MEFALEGRRALPGRSVLGMDCVGDGGLTLWTGNSLVRLAGVGAGAGAGDILDGDSFRTGGG